MCTYNVEIKHDVKVNFCLWLNLKTNVDIHRQAHTQTNSLVHKLTDNSNSGLKEPAHHNWA